MDKFTLSMYLSWNQQTITDFSDANVEALYDQGYVFTRPGKGLMKQTRSVRIDLSKFILNSENRRVLHRVQDYELETAPLPYADYHWSIAKLGKDFYTKKFGPKIFSANKIKEMLTDPAKSNFNLLLYYVQAGTDKKIGYCVCLETKNILHYSYPFYDLDAEANNPGLGMMLKAILHAKVEGKRYVYIGSAQRPGDTYKLQFEGLEWFDGKEWKTDLEELKGILKS